MANPDLKPVTQAAAPVPPPPPPPFTQSFGAKLAVAFSTSTQLPVRVIALSLPIVVSATGAFLLIQATASGTIDIVRETAMNIAIDGVPVTLCRVANMGGVGSQIVWAITTREPIAPGPHTIDVEFGNVSPGTTVSIDPVLFPDTDSVSLMVIESAA